MNPAPGGGVAAARVVKEHVRQLVGGTRAAVGLTKLDQAWAVKVNAQDVADLPELPDVVDGVPIVVREVGRITPHAG